MLVISYYVPGISQGVWLARGTGILGVSEQPAARGPELNGPTIFRGVLLLPHSTFDTRHSTLLDASGRRVLALHPGPNDIRHLSPGIYFIREESARTTRKVLVTK